jgi:hypothetical protein
MSSLSSSSFEGAGAGMARFVTNSRQPQAGHLGATMSTGTRQAAQTVPEVTTFILSRGIAAGC